MRPEVYGDLYERLLGKLLRWLAEAVELLPNTVVALVVLLAFWLLSVASAAGARRAFHRMGTDEAAARLMVTLLRLGVLGTGLFCALDLLGLNTFLTSLLAGAGILGLALGFAFQDLASNLISGVGLAIARKRAFQVGDLVETNGFTGVVEHVGLRTTYLGTVDGKQIVVPNKHIYQAILVNLTASGRRRIDLVFGVDRNSDLARVTEVTRAALESVQPRLADPPPRVYLRRFTESAIEVLCWIWVEFSGPEDVFKAEHEAIIALQIAYAEAGITLPFPIRTLDVRDKAGGLVIRQL